MRLAFVFLLTFLTAGLFAQTNQGTTKRTGKSPAANQAEVIVDPAKKPANAKKASNAKDAEIIVDPAKNSKDAKKAEHSKDAKKPAKK